MKWAMFLASVATFLVTQMAFAGSVRGYRTKRGKFVLPYHRTSPNHTRIDNYSAKGNTNPYTGKAGGK